MYSKKEIESIKKDVPETTNHNGKDYDLELVRFNKYTLPSGGIEATYRGADGKSVLLSFYLIRKGKIVLNE